MLIVCVLRIQDQVCTTTPPLCRDFLTSLLFLQPVQHLRWPNSCHTLVHHEVFQWREQLSAKEPQGEGMSAAAAHCTAPRRASSTLISSMCTYICIANISTSRCSLLQQQRAACRSIAWLPPVTRHTQAHFSAPSSVRRKLMSAPLSTELRNKYSVRHAAGASSQHTLNTL